MTRYKNCGAAVVLPTAPAWTFGNQHKPDDLPAGPGTGKYPSNDDWTAKTTRMGGLPAAQDRPWQDASMSYTGTRYLRPDYCSQNPKGPEWTFGKRTGKGNSLPPGVGTYSPNTNTFNYNRHPHAVWGPPPRPRPPSAPPPAPPLSPERRRRAPGPSFGLKHLGMKDPDSPGPAYNPCCGKGGSCCDMCEKYKGPSFGIRHPRHVEPPTPAPDYYHVGCTTLGAAAAGCTDANDPDHSYHKPTRRDHAYASGKRP
ncbi:hypothetical protein HYH03_013370 [Edaphochlamys debaryana]|uniref:Uncharacterized protein n=1 Tax=Edaphochlamys debaryana TaxID=47281 RepID=A0A836BTG2_9CHLO|nr:hypothetical protein HYH03_013370 [Edaphochlamys debaryana]|eukprot:KAG2488067.1 hypothetical protein HYH03_013370 [Edaphochlamys debaryana]